MSVMTAGAAPAAAARGSALARLTVTELRLFGRERLRLGFALALPVVLLIILGSFGSLTKPDASFGGYSFLDIYLPTLITFTMALLSIATMPMVLACYREIGVLRRMETTPAGPVRVLAAQLLANLAIAVTGMVLLLVVGRAGYHIAVPRQFAGFVLAWLFAAAALLSVGLFIAALAPAARTGQISGLLTFYPLMFFAGLWVPLKDLSPFWQHVSHATPGGAAVEALTRAAQGQWPTWLQLVTLAVYAVAFGSAAARLFRWE
jgi:ABC-2 type transport system permease protein